MQSVDPTLLALNVANTATQNAKKKVLPSLSTQAIAKPSLNVQTQQSQATFTPPTAKVGGISSPFGAPNINSAPILWWATPTEIKETATQLQSLPRVMPQTWAEPKTNIRDRLSTMWGDIVLRGKWLAEIKQAYPEFAHIDDETFKKIGGDIALRGKGIDDILRDYPELQQKINTKEKTTAQQIATPFVRFARWVADVGAWIQEGIDTWLSKLWILPDQTAINRKARVKDEEMTQQILGKKAWYEQYVQEWWRIAWSFIANAPANKLLTVGKMALWAAEWLLWWATYNLSTGEWVWSPVNLWLSTVIGAVVPWIVPAFKAIKWLSKEPSIRTAFAESLKEWARTNVAKALAPTWKKYKQLTDRLTDEFLDRGLRWSKESLLQSAKEWVEKFWAKIDDAIAWWALDNVEMPTQPLKELLQEAKKSVMVWWNVVNTAKAKVIDWLEEVLTPFQNTIGWKEARRFKQILDEIVYSTKGGIWAEDMTYKNILSKWMADVLRKQLSEAAPDLAKLNKDFSFYKSLEDVLEATMLRQRPQQWAVRKFIAWAFAGNQEWVVNKVVGYVWSKLFLDATSWATRNTLSAVAKNKLANAIATGSPKVINSVVQEMNDTHWLWLPLYDDVAVWAGNTMLKWTNIANTPKPMAKTPPITVEKGAMGMWTPKIKPSNEFIRWKEMAKLKPLWLPLWSSTSLWTTKQPIITPQTKKMSNIIEINKTPVIPKNPTVAPSVWAPKWFKWLWKETMEQNMPIEKKDWITLYHWTNEQFDKFLESKMWAWEGSELYGKGVYLTDSKDLAKSYASLVAKNKNPSTKFMSNGIFGTDVPVYPENIDKLIEGNRNLIETTVKGNLLDADTFKIPKDLKQVIIDSHAKHFSLWDSTSERMVWRVFDYMEKNVQKINGRKWQLDYVVKQIWNQWVTSDIMKYIKSKWYDGIKYTSDTKFMKAPWTNYMIFDPNKVKILKNTLFSMFWPVMWAWLLYTMLQWDENKTT